MFIFVEIELNFSFRLVLAARMCIRHFWSATAEHSNNNDNATKILFAHKSRNTKLKDEQPGIKPLCHVRPLSCGMITPAFFVYTNIDVAFK